MIQHTWPLPSGLPLNSFQIPNVSFHIEVPSIICKMPSDLKAGGIQKGIIISLSLPEKAENSAGSTRFIMIWNSGFFFFEWFLFLRLKSFSVHPAKGCCANVFALPWLGKGSKLPSPPPFDSKLIDTISVKKKGRVAGEKTTNNLNNRGFLFVLF